LPMPIRVYQDAQGARHLWTGVQDGMVPLSQLPSIRWRVANGDPAREGWEGRPVPPGAGKPLG
jgi:hypothetical protein